MSDQSARSDPEKARLVATIEAMSDFVGIAAADGTIHFLNRAGRQLLGLADSVDVAALRATAFHPPDTTTRLATEGFPSALRDGTWAGEGELLTVAGDRVAVSIVLVAHAPDRSDGTPIFSVIMRDVSDRATSADALRESDAALQRSNARFRSAIDGSLDGFSEERNAEEDLWFLLEVTRLVASSPDVNSALLTVLDSVCESAGWEYGESWIESEQPVATDATNSNSAQLVRGPVNYPAADSALARFALEGSAQAISTGVGLPGDVWASGRTTIVPSMDDPRIDLRRKPLALAARLRAGVAVPVFAANRLVAVLAFFMRDPARLDERRIDFLAALATQIGANIGQKLGKRQLADQRAFLATVLDSLSENVSVCDAAGRLTLYNRATREAYGLAESADVPAEWWSEYYSIYLPDGRTPFPADQLPHARVLRDGQDVRDLEFVVAVPGPPRTMMANAHVLRGTDGAVLGSVCASTDVTARRNAERALRESEAQFRGVLENVRSLAMTFDVDGRIRFVNKALLDCVGRTREELLGTSWFDIFAPGDDIKALFVESLARGEIPAHFETPIETREGERRLIAWDNTMLRHADGSVTGTASIGRDVTEDRELESRLAALSEYDELTGLSNRRGFRRMAEQELKSGRRAGRRGAVLFIDLDGLKPINDTYGHAAGDDALRAAASVLRETVRDADFVGRLGGDEFAIFATGTASAAEGEVLAARLRDALAKHNAVARGTARPFDVAFSIGVAEVESPDDLDSVMARADAALYAQKPSRR